MKNAVSIAAIFAIVPNLLLQVMICDLLLKTIHPTTVNTYAHPMTSYQNLRSNDLTVSVLYHMFQCILPNWRILEDFYAKH
jgi:hypothetical protein